MLIIDDIIISDDLFLEEFHCNLTKCKGACCVEGEHGAPLENHEIDILKREYNNYKSYLTKEGILRIESNGFFETGDEKEMYTPLINGGPCAFINYENGIAVCGIEKAFNDNKTSFRKPESCYLYPVRKNQIGNLVALNYDKWDICSAACSFGKENKTVLYKFLKNPLISAFGQEFFDKIDQYYIENYQ